MSSTERGIGRGAGARRELDLQTKVTPLRPGLVRRVEEYVEENLERDIGLSELAHLCYMSVDHFLRSYRAARGITPYRYVLEQRLRRASTMLRTTSNRSQRSGEVRTGATGPLD